MRPAKPQVPFTIRMDENIAKRLDAFSKKTGITKTKATEIALKQYLDQMEKIADQINPE